MTRATRTSTDSSNRRPSPRKNRPSSPTLWVWRYSSFSNCSHRPNGSPSYSTTCSRSPSMRSARYLGKSHEACRQLASRARRRVRTAQEPPPIRERQREVVDAFLGASREGRLPDPALAAQSRRRTRRRRGRRRHRRTGTKGRSLRRRDRILRWRTGRADGTPRRPGGSRVGPGRHDRRSPSNSPSCGQGDEDRHDRRRRRAERDWTSNTCDARQTPDRPAEATLYVLSRGPHSSWGPHFHLSPSRTRVATMHSSSIVRPTDTVFDMTKRTSPPFRADHVGSLLRPPKLLEARASFADGHDRRRRTARS